MSKDMGQYLLSVSVRASCCIVPWWKAEGQEDMHVSERANL